MKISLDYGNYKIPIS